MSKMNLSEKKRIWQEISEEGMRVTVLMKMTGGYLMTCAVIYSRKRV